MLEILIAHHTPTIPNPMADNTIAIGIRNELKVMLMIAGGTVRPVP